MTPRLAPPAAACRLTVCIPARDEAGLIGETLAALCAQRGFDGAALAGDSFDAIVLANNCRDATAAIARQFARDAPIGIFVVEQRYAQHDAHIGTARRSVMDVAAERFIAAGRPEGIIASLDSDTRVDAHWVAAIMREMNGCDAVGGHVTIAEADQERLLAPVRLLYARELAYRRVLADVEALIDPQPHDPPPRHGSFVGASFAVSAQCYRAAGGVPALRRLEDVAFSLALRRIDAKVRHSTLVRATTSARTGARVSGGFGTFIAELDAHARRGESFLVEHPLRSLEDLTIRAAIRRLREGRQRPDDIAASAAILGLLPAAWLPLIDPAAPVGSLDEMIRRRARSTRRRYPQVRVEIAIDTLRHTLAGHARHVLATPDVAAELDSLDAG
jgi:hypothetical protein